MTNAERVSCYFEIKVFQGLELSFRMHGYRAGAGEI